MICVTRTHWSQLRAPLQQRVHTQTTRRIHFWGSIPRYTFGRDKYSDPAKLFLWQVAPKPVRTSHGHSRRLQVWGCCQSKSILRSSAGTGWSSSISRSHCGNTSDVPVFVTVFTARWKCICWAYWSAAEENSFLWTSHISCWPPGMCHSCAVWYFYPPVWSSLEPLCCNATVKSELHLWHSSWQERNWQQHHPMGERWIWREGRRASQEDLSLIPRPEHYELHCISPVVKKTSFINKDWASEKNSFFPCKLKGEHNLEVRKEVIICCLYMIHLVAQLRLFNREKAHIQTPFPPPNNFLYYLFALFFLFIFFLTTPFSAPWAVQ